MAGIGPFGNRLANRCSGFGPRILRKFTLSAAFDRPVIPFAGLRPYIGPVRACPDYGDKRARNKRTGPGCDSRRLHQHLFRVSPESMGPISIDRRLKVFAFSRPDPPLRVIKLNANDNFAEEFAVAA